jgi:ABC-type polysaccharide/polyol phosphate transport system ATPase subunit
MTTGPTAIRAEGVSKTFRIPHEHVHTLKEKALHPFRRTGHEDLHALRGVSFDVQPGEFYGIVGRNGSGKSTLLKCLAGIYRADGGGIYISGRVSTFIELGVGFNPDLAAYDNVLLNATMLGLSTREARRRYDAIIDFAELHDFVDLKLKNYSSGMMVRLAFSVMIQVDADVLLIDEVLAVGDAAFQQKCYDEFTRIRRSGATVCLVTHDMSAVQRFCDRAMLLERGRAVEIGDPQRVGNRYLELNFSKEARAAQAGETAADLEPSVEQDRGTRFTEGSAEIADAWFENASGKRTDVLAGGQPCTFVMRVRFHQAVEDPLFGFELNTVDDPRPTVVVSSLWTDPHTGEFEQGEEITVRMDLVNVFAADRYEVSAAVARHDAWIDRFNRFLSIVVTGTRDSGAYVEPPFTVEIERAAAPDEVVGR